MYAWHGIRENNPVSSSNTYNKKRPGARLSKNFDVTSQKYRNSQAKIEKKWNAYLACMGFKFRVKFQSVLWNFTQNLEPVHRKICILRGVTKIDDLRYLKVMTSQVLVRRALRAHRDIQMSYYQDKNSHHPDNAVSMVSRPSYLFNRNRHASKDQYFITLRGGPGCCNLNVWLNSLCYIKIFMCKSCFS